MSAASTPTCTPGSTPAKEAGGVKRAGKRTEQATPMPATSPVVPTPGTKHPKLPDDIDDGLKSKRKLFEGPGT